MSLGEFVDSAQVIAAVLSAATAVISAVISYLAWEVGKQSRATADQARQIAEAAVTRDSAIAAHRIIVDLTTGDVADARNIIGTLIHDDTAKWKELTRAEAVRAFYVLLWCVERTTHARGSRARPIDSSILDVAMDMADWHVCEIVHNLSLLREPLKMNDRAAWSSLQQCAQELGTHVEKRLSYNEAEATNVRDRVTALTLG